MIEICPIKSFPSCGKEQLYFHINNRRFSCQRLKNISPCNTKWNIRMLKVSQYFEEEM